jgi:DNA-binding protein YbaB
MFNKLKQISQLKAIKREMEQAKFEVTKDGVTVVINGAMTVENITLNPELNIERQSRMVTDCVNEAIKKSQQEMAKKLQGMGDLGFGA